MAAMTPPEQMYDVFISYSSNDLATAEALHEAFAGQEIEGRRPRVWFDRREIDRLDDIVERLDHGIRHSRSVVALLSEHLIGSNPCRWEAIRTLTLRGRDGVDRYIPINLRDVVPDRWASLLQRHALPWTDASDTARQILARVQNLPAPGAEGADGLRSSALHVRNADLGRFVGRLDSLLDIHSELSDLTQLNRGTQTTKRTVAIVGLGGMGKSALALKYAQEFASSFPAGVEWIDAGGDEVNNEADSAAKRDLVIRNVRRQVADRVAALRTERGLDAVPRAESGDPILLLQQTQAEMRALLDAASGPTLWILDDLPSDLDDLIPLFSCPSDPSLTLVTTRAALPASHFRNINLTALEPSEAMRLFRLAIHGMDDLPWSLEGEELTAAQDLAGEVGYFPLALDLLAARMRTGRSPIRLLRELRARAARIINIPDSLLGTLPTQHTSSIVATLQTTFADAVRVDPNAFTPLRLLAVTAAEPAIPAGLLTAAGGACAVDDLDLDDALLLLNRVGLLTPEKRGSEDPDGEIEPQRVHAITRLVALHLASERLAPWTSSAEDRAADRAIARAATEWLHDVGDGHRNSNDAEASRWFQRALTPLGYSAEDRGLRVIEAACCRGIARNLFRSPPQDSSDSTGGKKVALEYAQQLIERARATIAAGLLTAPNDDDLLLEQARIQALKGDVLDQQLARGYLGDDVDAAEVNLSALTMVLDQAEYRQRRLDGGLLTRFKVAEPATHRTTEIDAARAWINVPGRLLKRAKLVAEGSVAPGAPHSDPEALLARAHEIYAEIEERRELLFPVGRRTPGETEEIAACANGRAIVGYVRANLFRTDPTVRLTEVLDALSAVRSAVRLRWSGANEVNASKSVLLAAKLGLAARAVAAPGDGADLGPVDRAVEIASSLTVERTGTGGTPSPGLADVTWREELDAALGADAGLVEAEPSRAQEPGRATVLRRNAASRALLLALDDLEAAIGRVDTTHPTGPGPQQDPSSEIAAAGLAVAASGAVWLRLVERAGATATEKAARLTAEWQEEGPAWIG